MDTRFIATATNPKDAESSLYSICKRKTYAPIFKQDTYLIVIIYVEIIQIEIVNFKNEFNLRSCVFKQQLLCKILVQQQIT